MRKISKKRHINETLIVDENSFHKSSLKKLKSEFNSDNTNHIIQNALCANDLHQVCEVREYMQSIDTKFSHEISPELVVTDQGRSGRCWLFSDLNILRHRFVTTFNLPNSFEFSESYLSFYEKIEKCNYFLNKFMNKDEISRTDLNLRSFLSNGLFEGGYWITGANLIKKYGLIPKSCYLESMNSYNTGTIDNLVSTKLREYALILTKTKPENRVKAKSDMMKQIYSILAKMLGTPPCPNEKFEWSFSNKTSIVGLIATEMKVLQNGGEYTISQDKHTIKITPLEFYKKFVCINMDDYMNFANDPRNSYYNYYESSNDDPVQGNKQGYYNIPIEKITELCITSIKNNTPVHFSCDVNHYFNPYEDLFDTKCFNYDLLFNTSFDNLSKKEMMEVCESNANHAMVFVGVDLDKQGKPIKWKVENSWGYDWHSANYGYYTISHEWFEKYVYEIAIHKDNINQRLCNSYNKSKNTKVILPDFDIMGNYDTFKSNKILKLNRKLSKCNK
jgi:bleomycin hydrolase